MKDSEMSMTDKNEYLAFAKSVALEAGEIMRKYFGQNPESYLKEDKTIVTVADEEINAMVIVRVKEKYPSHDIDSEEASDKKGSDYLWVCDPIDGTLPFAMTLPTSVFSLALVVDGKPEVGVVYAPFGDHMYWAVTGGGAFMNGRPIQVNDGRLEGGSAINIDWWASASYDIMKVAHKLSHEKGVYVLEPGSATHAAVLVARGAFVASIFSGTKGKHVDIAAAKVIVEEAGGKVTDLFGENQRYDQDIRGAVVSNGVVHDEIIEALREVVG